MNQSSKYKYQNKYFVSIGSKWTKVESIETKMNILKVHIDQNEQKQKNIKTKIVVKPYFYNKFEKNYIFINSFNYNNINKKNLDGYL